VRALASLTDDELRTRARALWFQLYAQPYAPMVDSW
jgi:hypothetical protein